MLQPFATGLRESLRNSYLIVVNDVNVEFSALVGARKDGKSIFAGKKVTGFSNTEEEAVGRVKVPCYRG